MALEQDAIRSLLRFIGENPDREGLTETPFRVLKSYLEFFQGYRLDPKQVLAKTFVEGKCDEMVVVTGIPFTSFCEHHWLPFQGVTHVGYLPDKSVVGLSKIPRLVDVFAKRLQIQERMTAQIAEAMMQFLNPKGVGVVVEAEHLCLSCRGAKKEGVVMVTSALRGAFKDDPVAKQEFLGFCRSRL